MITPSSRRLVNPREGTGEKSKIFFSSSHILSLGISFKFVFWQRSLVDSSILNLYLEDNCAARRTLRESSLNVFALTARSSLLLRSRSPLQGSIKIPSIGSYRMALMVKSRRLAASERITRDLLEQ